MNDLHWVTALVSAHLGHSLALSACLAGILLATRNMSGAARYSLCAFAMVAAIVLPVIVFSPGSSVGDRLLKAVGAPITLSGETAAMTANAADPIVSVTQIAAADTAAGSFEATSARTSEAAIGDPAAALAPEVYTQPASDLIATGWGVSARWANEAAAILSQALSILPDFTLFLICAWVVGSLVLLTKTARDLASSAVMLRNAQPIDLPPALAKRFEGVRIAVSDRTPGPIAAGILRPSILLPLGFETQLASPGIAALLEHERAHIERRDMLVALLQRIALALLWWSPALHWISRRMDEEREVACDEVAVDRTGDARAFALTLTDQAEIQMGARTPQLAAGAIGGKSQFGRRIRRLIELRANGSTGAMRGGQGAGRLAFTGLAAVALLAACLTPVVEAKDEPKAVQLAQVANTFDEVDAQSSAEPAPPPAPPASAPEAVPLAPLPPIPRVSDRFQSDRHEDVAALLADDMLADLPELVEEILESIEQAGVGDDDFSADWQEELEDMRRELRDEFGPEFRLHLANELARGRAERERAMAEARAEIARARAEMERELARASVEIERAKAEVARALASSDAHGLSPEEREAIRRDVEQALEEAREEIRAARERGDLDIHFDFESDDSGQEWEEELEGQDHGSLDREYYRPSGPNERAFIDGPRAAPEEFRDFAALDRPRYPNSWAPPSTCPQQG